MTTSTGEGRTDAKRSIPQDTFAARLMLARMHAGSLSIVQAAERCGLTNQSWSNWENGRMPRDRVEVAQAVSEGLGIDFDWLLFGGPLAQPADKRRPRRSATDEYQTSGPRTPTRLLTGHSAPARIPAAAGSPRRPRRVA